MNLRGNAFLVILKGTKVLKENDDGTYTMIVLEEQIKVCSNAQAAYSDIDHSDDGG